MNHLGLHIPTKVQVEAIPAIASGSNVMISAATGTGKTLAYLLPSITKVMTLYKSGELKKHKKELGRKGHPSVLVLVPNRELGSQVNRIQ